MGEHFPVSESENAASIFDSGAFESGVYTRTIQPRNPDGGWHLVLHGLGDHSGAHTWAASLLAATGSEVVAIDWPGCGKSGLSPSHLPTVPEAKQIINSVIEKKGGPPRGVFAHSTGGFFLMSWLLDKGASDRLPKWVWFSSPLISPRYGQGELKILAARLAGHLFPRLTLKTGVTPSACYHGGNEEAKWKDPLFHNKVSVRAGASLLEEADVIRSSFEDLPAELAYLIVQGWNDPVCPPEFSRDMLNRLSANDKTYLLVHDGLHEPFHEKECEPLTNAIRAWLRSRNL